MSDEKTPKHFWIIGLVICALIAILATIDLSGIWKKVPQAKVGINKESKDAIFNFAWDVKMCDEVHIDSLGARVKVMQHSYNTETCERFNEHHDCEVWRDNHFTYPKLAMMKGWDNATKVTYDTVKYTYDSLGNATRVIKKRPEDGGYVIADRAVKHDSKNRVVETATKTYFKKAGSKDTMWELRVKKYKYNGDQLDSIFHKFSNFKGDTASRWESCTEYKTDCLLGATAESKFVPTSVIERIYHESRNDGDKKLWEKFEEKEGSMTILKYCHDEDFSYEIAKALPRSNYPGADTTHKGAWEK